MSLPVDVEIVAEAQKRAEREVLDMIGVLQDRLVSPNGDTFGTAHMSREDRILMFLDDVKSGALDHLKVLNEKAYFEYVKQYTEDLQHSPQLQPQGVR